MEEEKEEGHHFELVYSVFSIYDAVFFKRFCSFVLCFVFIKVKKRRLEPFFVVSETKCSQ